MEVRTTRSLFLPFHQLEEPYRKIVAIETPDGYVECQYMNDITSPVTTETFVVPEEMAVRLGRLFEHTAAVVDPERITADISPTYQCFNIVELQTGEPLDMVEAQRRAEALAAEYEHHDPFEPLPAGTLGVIRNPHTGQLFHSFISLGEPLDANGMERGAPSETASLLEQNGNMGIMDIPSLLEAYRSKNRPTEIAIPPGVLDY